MSTDDMTRLQKTGEAAYASIKGMVEALREGQAKIEATADNEIVDTSLYDEAFDYIGSDPLSVTVRGDWYTPGSGAGEPVEYCILLSTGGPATRIIGALDGDMQPANARLQVQDWFLPWTDYRPLLPADLENGADEIDRTLLEYARCFYYGE